MSSGTVWPQMVCGVGMSCWGSMGMLASIMWPEIQDLQYRVNLLGKYDHVCRHNVARDEGFKG